MRPAQPAVAGDPRGDFAVDLGHQRDGAMVADQRADGAMAELLAGGGEAALLDVMNGGEIKRRGAADVDVGCVMQTTT